MKQRTRIIRAWLCAVCAASPILVLETASAAPSAPSSASLRVGDKDALKAARAGLVERLIKLAEWCSLNEIYEERDKVYREVQTLDPDNLEAHKGLRQIRAQDGSWHDGAKREAKNRNPKALLELPKKRSEAIGPYGALLVAQARAPETDAATRKALLDEVLALDPDDASLHTLWGDVRDGDRWVSPETARSKPRRAELKKLVADSVASVAAPRSDPVKPVEIQLDLGWKSTLATDGVRVLATVPDDAAQKVARTCQAVGPFLSAVFGTPFSFPENFTVHLIAPAEKQAFLARVPNVDDAERARLAKMEGTGLPQSDNIAIWQTDPTRMLDAAVRHTMCHLLQKNIGLSTRCGWIWEGFGFFTTRMLVGTRHTWFAAEEATGGAAGAPSLRSQLLAPDANWMNSALVLLTSPEAPRLERVLTRDLAHFETADVLVGYAFAAYLLESRADVVAQFVRRAAAGEDPAAISRALLALSLDELQEHLVRWLSERR